VADAVSVGVGDALCDGVADAVCDGVAEAVGDGVDDAVWEGVADTVSDGDGVTVTVAVDDLVGAGLFVGIAVAVAVEVGGGGLVDDGSAVGEPVTVAVTEVVAVRMLTTVAVAVVLTGVRAPPSSSEQPPMTSNSAHVKMETTARNPIAPPEMVLVTNVCHVCPFHANVGARRVDGGGWNRRCAHRRRDAGATGELRQAHGMRRLIS